MSLDADPRKTAMALIEMLREELSSPAPARPRHAREIESRSAEVVGTVSIERIFIVDSRGCIYVPPEDPADEVSADTHAALR